MDSKEVSERPKKPPEPHTGGKADACRREDSAPRQDDKKPAELMDDDALDSVMRDCPL